MAAADPRVFDPYAPGTQPMVPIPGYMQSRLRNPSEALVRRALTLSERTGPVWLASKVAQGENNLAFLKPGVQALGSLTRVSGHVRDEDGRPVRGAMIEVWQCNAAGKYAHAADQRAAPLDPDFRGSGRVLTDDSGRYEFLTIKPAAYPVPDTNHWWRPPHIHFSIYGDGIMSRLVTQMYFPGEPLNAHCLILNSVPDASARERLVARFVAPVDAPADSSRGALAFSHDMVLRGRQQTPFTG